jgi:xylulokinase
MIRVSQAYLGLDLGTQGVRCVAVDEAGGVLASVEKALPPPPEVSAGRAEQEAEAWWPVCAEALAEVCAGRDGVEPAAVSVDSTSGTFVPVDAVGRALRPALMYNDARAVAEAEEINGLATDFTARLGYGFPAAFALPKILWLARHEPEIWARTAKVLHAADFVVARLCGEVRYSDWSNALKSGYDLLEERWPDFIVAIGIDPAKLPDVVPSGSVAAEVSAEAAEETGLPAGLPIVAGCSDGTASLLATGISAPGEWNSTLGTTLAIRGISADLVRDPQGRIYCHRHPDGLWLPGGASNTGAGPLAVRFGEDTLLADSARAAAAAPYDAIVYPLVGRGERMPLSCPAAEGFAIGEPEDPVARLGAWMQGQALAERWCFELCEELGCPVGEWVAVTGGAARNDAWLQLRADVLGRELRRPRHAHAAYGSALLAMAGRRGEKVSEIARRVVEFEVAIEPRAQRAAAYAELLARMKAAVAERWP